MRPQLYNKRKAAQRERPIPASAIYIGRPSPWENPFKLTCEGDRERVIAEYRRLALDRLEREPDWLEPLRGKDLVCFCYPKACHGDVLMDLLYNSLAAKSDVCAGCGRLLSEHDDCLEETPATGYDPTAHYMNAMAAEAGVEW